MHACAARQQCQCRQQWRHHKAPLLHPAGCTSSPRNLQRGRPSQRLLHSIPAKQGFWNKCWWFNVKAFISHKAPHDQSIYHLPAVFFLLPKVSLLRSFLPSLKFLYLFFNLTPCFLLTLASFPLLPSLCFLPAFFLSFLLLLLLLFWSAVNFHPRSNPHRHGEGSTQHCLPVHAPVLAANLLPPCGESAAWQGGWLSCRCKHVPDYARCRCTCGPCGRNDCLGRRAQLHTAARLLHVSQQLNGFTFTIEPCCKWRDHRTALRLNLRAAWEWKFHLQLLYLVKKKKKKKREIKPWHWHWKNLAI